MITYVITTYANENDMDHVEDIVLKSALPTGVKCNRFNNSKTCMEFYKDHIL